MTPTAPDHAGHPPPRRRGAHGAGWDVVIPVKPLAQAKSRLAGLGDDVRRDLALAFLLDVVSAVPRRAGCARDRGGHRRRARGRTRARPALGERVPVVPDAEPTELNRALHRGVAELRAAPAPRGGRVLALCADLPALTPAPLADLLADAAPGAGRRSSPTTAGVGTTALPRPGAALFDPRFGAGSRGRARRRGAVDLTAPAPPGAARRRRHPRGPGGAGRRSRPGPHRRAVPRTGSRDGRDRPHWAGRRRCDRA